MPGEVITVPGGGEIALPVTSDAFAYGGALFETLKLAGGRLCFFDDHWRRLGDSAAALGIPLRARREEVLDAVRGLVATEGATDGTVKLSLLRAGATNPVVVYMRPSLPAAPGPARLCLSPARRNPDSLLATHKTHNYLENILLLRQARETGFSDALLLATDGSVAETATANVFWIAGGTLHTPSLETGILPGIVRAKVLGAAREAGAECRAGRFQLADFRSADAVFLTNSSLGLVAVVEYRDPEGCCRFDSRHPLVADLSERFAAVEAAESELVV